MKLTLDGIKDRQAWEKAGIKLPGYDVEAVSKKAKDAPGWVHFGIGNIFRVFIGGIADGLLEEGVLDRGITCVETFDYDVIDKIYKPGLLPWILKEKRWKSIPFYFLCVLPNLIICILFLLTTTGFITYPIK